MNKQIIIPDVHADHDRLILTLTAAGFESGPSGYRHPEGHKALFLGDLIDNGPENLRVITTVRSMVEDGEALCLMGNHELNAILTHGGHRARSEKNLKQHATFLRELPFGDPKAEEVLAWFRTLPLRAEFEGFRAAHAFWGDDAVFAPLTETHGDVILTHLDPDLLPEIGREEGALASEILDVTKGPEIRLPEGDFGFADHYGHWRTAGRLRWWGGPEFLRWEDAMISLGPDHRLPESAPGAAAAARAYPADAKPLFIGHYKMKGDVKPVAHNVVCLDYPAAEPFVIFDKDSNAFEIMDAKQDADPSPAP